MDHTGATYKTLRDDIAIAAMQGYLANHGWSNSFNEEWWARQSYKLADAMLTERDKKPHA